MRPQLCFGGRLCLSAFSGIYRDVFYLWFYGSRAHGGGEEADTVASCPVFEYTPLPLHNQHHRPRFSLLTPSRSAPTPSLFEFRRVPPVRRS